MTRHRFSLTGRRTVTWVGIILVVLGTFIYLTWRLPPNAIIKPALAWLVALIAWALAVLFWDLAIVWIEYVSESRHLDYLKEVWGVKEPRVRRGPRPSITGDKPAPVWWLRSPRSRGRS
jgi:hypothetical protein